MKNLLTASLITVATTSAVVHAEMPAMMKVGTQELILNGSGIRHGGVLKLYRGALYLTKRSSNAASIVLADEPMVIRIEITSRLVSQSKLDASLQEGFQKATQGNVQPISAEIAAFRKCLTERISKGDVFEFAYRPALGVAVSKNGQQKDVVPGIAFKQALFGIWLGDQPADVALKRGMLNSQRR